MNYYQEDIKLRVNSFKDECTPTERYASFDYCYNYFKTSSPDELNNNMEKSCLALGFYLASWGMFRGSSFLLQKSSKHFQSLIQYIASLDKKIWDIDVDNYSDENIEKIIEIYSEMKKCLIKNGNSHRTLITKIMMGVLVLYQHMIGILFNRLNLSSKENVRLVLLIKSH